MFDRILLLALTPLTLAGGAVGWTSISHPPTVASTGEGGERAAIEPGAAPITLHRSADGLFRAPVRINGQRVHMIVDTGATRSVLSSRAGRLMAVASGARAGSGTMRTMSGAARYRETRPVSMAIGSRRIDQIRLVVVDAPGDIAVVGQDVLRQLGTVTINGDELTLP